MHPKNIDPNSPCGIDGTIYECDDIVSTVLK